MVPHSAPRPSRPRSSTGRPAAKLTKSDLLKRLEDAGTDMLEACTLFLVSRNAGTLRLSDSCLLLESCVESWITCRQEADRRPQAAAWGAAGAVQALQACQ